MAIEIEHKYLVINDRYIGMAEKKINIAQGYLSRDKERTVRVRIYGNKGYLAVKGVTKGASREEYEYEIPVDDAKAMLEMCEKNVIRKTRYYVRYEGYIWEIDSFADCLSPLVIAEIELPTEDTEYSLPPFVGKNVTEDHRYYNSSLSSATELPPIE